MTSMPSPLLPPYGLMPTGLYPLPHPLKGPDGWNGLVDYELWLDAVARLLGDTLWPLWDAGSGWSGGAATRMEALTLADFALFPGLRALLDEPFRAGATEPNKVLFSIEDIRDVEDEGGTIITDKSLDRTLEIYFGGALDPSHLAIKNGYIGGLASNAGDIDLDLKARIRRPRAYQAAVILRLDDFTYEDATSAVTPSMISGHCFQTSMGGIAAWLAAKQAGLPDASLDAIAHHTCDVGDRRVMAGVHYPSDNISSWITALLAHPFVFGDKDSRDWYCETIRRYSAVHNAIAAAVGKNPQSPLAAPFALLESLCGATAQNVAKLLGLALLAQAVS